jgi:alanine-synthesizing transaminase
MQKKFELIEKLPTYIFAKSQELKQQAISRGIEIFDFGMGNPDLPPPQHVIDYFSATCKNQNLYGYSVTAGIDSLRKSLCNYYSRRFKVDLDWASETLVTMGATEGITSFALTVSDSKNHICVANPCYPIHNFSFAIARGKTHQINAIKPKDFLSKFKKHVESSRQKPIAVLVNYPNNPTTEIVDLSFYEELVSFCKKHQIYIISDLAYAEVYYDEKHKPHSILEVKGAKDIAIEFTSVSKSYCLPGCRVGFAVGNKNLIASLYKMKSYLDFGLFTPIQMAVAEALTKKSDEYLKNLRATYKRRAEFLVDLLEKELDWIVEKPKAGMFIWTKIPKKFSKLSSAKFVEKMIFETGVVMCPGDSFGSNGEGFVRISLIHDEEIMKKAISKMKQVL